MIMMNDILWLMSRHEYHSSTSFFERWCINEAGILDRIVIPHPGSDLIEPLNNRTRELELKNADPGLYP